jgi:hypothetical protein
VGTIPTATSGTLRNCQISGIVTGNLLIPNRQGTIYSFSGQVDVGVDGGTSGILTVEPGVVIFGSSGGDFLLVNRGSQLFAEGTASSPIIFTSRQNVTGDSGVDSIGQWGGVVVLGRAPISDCNTGAPTNPGGTRTDCEAIVEGPSNAVYGGNLPTDSSGRISFLQVRYPGFAVGQGNELNGITLGGVGRGTFFQNIQIHNSSDDGIEWFGGRVNGKNLALTGNDDDSIDSDLGYAGFNQFVLVVQRLNGGDRGWEADSNGNEDAEPRQDFRLANATIVSRGSSPVAQLRGGGDYALYNTILDSNGTSVCLEVDGAATVQAMNNAIDENGPPVFQSVFASCDVLADSSSGVTAATVMTIFNSGANNTATGTTSLVAGAAAFPFINGATENGVAVFDAAAVATMFGFTDFEAVTNIGAVSGANDTRFQGWTCGLFAADPACTTLPVIS